MKLNLTKIFNLQRNLDKHIHSEHHVNYEKIHVELKLALIVELAETANEIRSFKFWSYKPSSAKPIVLEEYADGLHFINSLCIYYKVKPNFDVKVKPKFKTKKDITKSFINLFKTAAEISSPKQAKAWYTKYLEFGFRMGFSFKEITKAYEAKCKVNHQRQNQKY